MNVHRALSEVAEIRAQLDRTANYRGFRSLTTGFSGLICLCGAIVQTATAETPANQVDRFLTIWLSVAIASSVLAGVEMIVRGLISDSTQVWKTHRRLVGNLLPPMIVGAVLTLVIANRALATADAGMMSALPGIWGMLFGLGIYACRHELPKPAIGIAVFYLLVGAIFAVQNSTAPNLNAWQMVILFGIGQLLLGFVLFWNVERKHG